MAGRSNRSRRRRRRAKLDSEASGSSPPQSSSSSSDDRTAQRKIPSSNRQQQATEEKPDLGRATRDARAVRSFLLGLIRSYYIDAISQLPTDELRTTLARGLLVGGYCYGPLHPVHNIIVNSVWYAAAFPFRATDSDPIDVDVITTESITRLALRSLDGLVAYLCHQCPALSHDGALRRLSLSHATLHGASFGRMELEAVPFKVAAQAAGHPKPAAFAHFATSVLPAVERDARSLFAGKCRLFSDDILRLSAVLQPPLPLPDEVKPQPCSPKLSVRINRIITERRRFLRMWYQTLLDIADAALRKFARQTGARYRLHTIYGQSIVQVGDCLLDRYFHINFMAWPKGKQNKSQTPVQFFAEAHRPPPRNCSEEDITFCCMLERTQLPPPRHVDNCCACAERKRRIDHPNGDEHFGGHPQKMGETEDDCECPSTVDVDYRFFDPDRDIDLVKLYADEIASDEAICAKLRSNRSKCLFAEDDGDDEDDHNDEVIAEEDMSNYCRRYI
ncbi:unnamed protein product [Urochloa humidicola]